MYPDRYADEPRKRLPYCEAYDYITRYGLPRYEWDYKKWKLDRQTMKEIWRTAEKDAAGKSVVCIIYDGALCTN